MDPIEFFQDFLRGMRAGIAQLITQGTDLRAQISDLKTRMENRMATLQEQLDALTGAVATGVQELRDEIARLAALPAGETVDFTALQGIADALAADNIPAAPVEEPPAEPVDEPVEP